MLERIALIADAHGNLPATRAVFEDIDAQGITRVISLGDMVGKGPSSPEVHDLCMARCEAMLYGNWDLGIAQEGKTASSEAKFYYQQLGDQRIQQILKMPQHLIFTFGDRLVKLFHGRYTVSSIVYSDSSVDERRAALNALGDDQSDVVIFADIHRPYLIMMEGRMLVNTGSVGNACDGLPQASYVVLTSRSGAWGKVLSVDHVRLRYDADQSIRDAQALVDLPHREEYIKEVTRGVYSR